MTPRAQLALLSAPPPNSPGSLALATFDDGELLALLLGGRASRARRLLQQVGGVPGLGAASATELGAVYRLAPTLARRLAVAIELGRRVASESRCEPGPLGTSTDVARRYGARLSSLCQELFLTLALDAKNRVTSETLVAVGTLTACPIHPRETFRALVREAASTVIFVHNHPSGDPSPSPDDVELTARLASAGELLGIRVLDHVIVARDGCYSFADAGLLGTRVP